MKTLLTGVTASAIAFGGLASAETTEQRLASLEKQLASLKTEKSNKFSGSSDLLSWAAKTSIGGYGELHYNNLEGKDDQIDFHRFVLYINHSFNDRLRLVSEVELEHSLAGDGKPGEVELEQAYVEMDFDNDLQVRAGLFLIPVGILNETHEPPTFFGVERNTVEKNIIPTTWWEAGVGVTKKFESGFIFDGSVTSSLNVPTTGSNEGRVRSGRGKVAEAIADSVAFTGRVTYVGTPGLKASAFAQYTTDIVQNDAGSDAGKLYGVTAQYEKGGFALRALYAKWDIDGEVPAASTNQSGWYVEPSYTWDLSSSSKIGVFARYENTEYYKGGEQEDKITTVGVNYWPHEQVVLKADFQKIDDGGSEKKDQINLGVGFQF